MTDEPKVGIARRQTILCTALTAAAVLATGASTMAVIPGADPGVTAPTVWE